jgi:hypothetical protein
MIKKEEFSIRSFVLVLCSSLLLTVIIICVSGGITLLNLLNALFLSAFILISISLTYFVINGGFFKGISYSFRRLFMIKEREMYSEPLKEPSSLSQSNPKWKELMKTFCITGFLHLAGMLVMLYLYYA